LTVRRLAILLSIVAISLFAFSVYNRPSQAFAVCTSCDAPSDIIRACTELIESSDTTPESLVSYLNSRAWAFRRSSDLDAAISDLDRALAVDPDILRTWVNRAYVHNAAGDIDAVAEDFDAALALEPDKIWTLMHRAKLSYLRGDYELAQQDYERITQLDSNNSRASVNLIAVHLKLENYDIAIELLNQAALNWPEGSIIYDALGRLYYYHSNNSEKALQAFSTVAELAPDSIMAPLYLAMVHFSDGNEELGQKYLVRFSEIFAELEPSDATVFDVITHKILKYYIPLKHLRMGLGYGAIGLPDRAKNSFNSYIQTGGYWASSIMSELVHEYAPEDTLDSYIEYLESKMLLEALADDLFRKTIQ